MSKLKLIFFLTVLTFCCCEVNGSKLKCSSSPVDMPKEWITMTRPCVEKMKEQFHAELEASMTYLAMGAHFHKDSINRLGFSKYFFESASEEREHAIRILEYLSMRGELKENIGELLRTFPMPKKTSWSNALEALKDALALETGVTERIRKMIETCESSLKDGENINYNDYHLADYLSSDFLGEQHKGQRELAGHISRLSKMLNQHSVIGEYIYDKNLQ